jgi:hypothetical protein
MESIGHDIPQHGVVVSEASRPADVLGCGVRLLQRPVYVLHYVHVWQLSQRAHVRQAGDACAHDAYADSADAGLLANNDGQR